jgi:transcriptional regulator with XRE-family HTH domain
LIENRQGPPAPPEHVGHRIAELRTKLGWTQQELADRVGVSRVAVSHLEAGMSNPGERTVALLAGVFHIEPHELVVGTSYPRAKIDRLPVVAARYTEVELQLELLAADLRWIERAGHDHGVLAEWDARLRALVASSHDQREVAALREAQDQVRRLL